jgi:hypothetical protein
VGTRNPDRRCPLEETHLFDHGRLESVSRVLDGNLVRRYVNRRYCTLNTISTVMFPDYTQAIDIASSIKVSDERLLQSRRMTQLGCGNR